MEALAESALRVDRLLHRSDRHEVWSAHLRASGSAVVLKCCAVGAGEQDRDRLRHEADLLGSISHPHVIPLIAEAERPPGTGLVLPHMTGGSLRNLLDHRGTLPPGELAAVLTGVASAVDHLARLGVVHADLKPGNVLLTSEGSPVLADLGSAVRTGRVATRRGHNREGTVAYTDPAVAQGEEPGALSEVYALGVVAYECLTGRPPHRGTPAEVVALAAAGVHRPLGSWPSVPAAVAALVEQALSPDPGQRPPDATTFVAALRAAAHPDPVVLPVPAPTEDRSGLARPADQTTPFGPRRPTASEVDPSCDRWRVAVAALIAAALTVTLWMGAGLLFAV